ncbi:polysaccharide biosynthesis tyrosine autokinase [Nitrospira sp. BLG_1]|uniref:polysaccharide biosynthesis tyrosine autokinase n=1 Tax=Nitrospira sp. BLG_1 TaxID=3395883 RepID=UPI0039BD0C55
MQYPDLAASPEQTGFAQVHEYVLIVSRNKWIIAGAIALSLILAGMYLLIAPKYYQSQTLIVEEGRKGIDNVLDTGENTDRLFEKRLFLIQKQIRSRDFLRGLEKEFSEHVEGRDGTSAVIDWDELAGGVMVERAMIDPAGGKSQLNLLDGFVVSVFHQDPQTARRVAAGIADRFIQENNRERERDVEGTGEFLDEELRALKRELEKKEDNLSSFKKSHVGGLPSQAETNMRSLDRIEADITRTTEDLQRHSEKLAMLNQAVQQYRASGQQSPGFATSRSMAPDPLFNRLRELREQLVKLRAEFWDGYPEVVLVKEQLRQVEDELVNVYGRDVIRSDKAPLDPYLQDLAKLQSEVRTELALLQRRLEQLHSSKQELEKRLERSPIVEQELLILERDYNTLKNNYTMLLDKRLHTRVEENIEKRQKSGKYRIIDKANLPTVPAIPNTPRVLVLGFLFGCVLGGGLAVLRERLTEHFRSPEDVEFLLAGPRLLAAIPDFASLWHTGNGSDSLQRPALPRPSLGMTMNSRSELAVSNRSAVGQSSFQELDRRFITKLFPRSMAAEQYRVAAARLQLANEAGGPAVVAVTSAIKGEGKTTTVINLGYTLARDFGRRVLLVDCDFVFPEMAAFLEAPVEYGLIDCLRGDVSPQQAMGAFSDVSCWIMPAGKSVAGSTELLRAGQLNGVLSQLRDEFDYILLNAPPILPVATMNVLESHCDLHLLVVRANVTSKQAVKQAVSSLRAQKPIHVILNGVASNSLPSYMLDYSPRERSVAV